MSLSVGLRIKITGLNIPIFRIASPLKPKIPRQEPYRCDKQDQPTYAVRPGGPSPSLGNRLEYLFIHHPPDQPLLQFLMPHIQRQPEKIHPQYLETPPTAAAPTYHHVVGASPQSP